MHQFERTERLIGKDGIEKLKKARVAVFGIGGVGGYVVEALARSGVGALDLIDSDTISPSNINRQIYALHSTVGRLKTDVAKERIWDINPEAEVRTYPVFYLPDTADQFCLSRYDYVVDAIDTVTAKLELIARAKAAGVPIISAMGAGNKMDAAAFKVADISQTKVCPLAKVMRRELKKRGIEGVKVVYSEESVVRERTEEAEEDKAAKDERTPGSNAFVPAAAGLIIAGEVVRELCGRGTGNSLFEKA